MHVKLPDKVISAGSVECAGARFSCGAQQDERFQLYTVA